MIEAVVGAVMDLSTLAARAGDANPGPRRRQPRATSLGRVLGRILVPRAHATGLIAATGHRGRFLHLWHAPRESRTNPAAITRKHVAWARPTRIPSQSRGMGR